MNTKDVLADFYRFDNWLTGVVKDKKSILRSCYRKQCTTIAIPAEVSDYDMQNLALVNPEAKKKMPRYNSEELVRDSDMFELFTWRVIDGKLVFGEYKRADYGLDEFIPTTLAEEFAKHSGIQVGLNSNFALRQYVKINNELFDEFDQAVLADLMLISNNRTRKNMWIRNNKRLNRLCVEVTKEILDSGIDTFYPWYFPRTYHPGGHFENRRQLNIGDVIVINKDDEQDQLMYTLVTEKEFNVCYAMEKSNRKE